MQEHFHVESFLSFAQELALLCMQITPMLTKKESSLCLKVFAARMVSLKKKGRD